MARNTGPTWRISRRLNFSVLETGVHFLPAIDLHGYWHQILCTPTKGNNLIFLVIFQSLQWPDTFH